MISLNQIIGTAPLLAGQRIKEMLSVQPLVGIFYKINGSWYQGKRVNLSKGGACIFLNHAVDIGQSIDIEMPRKSFKTKAVLKMSGHVAWVDISGHRSYLFKCGIAFEQQEIRSCGKSSILWFLADLHCKIMSVRDKDSRLSYVKDIEELKNAFGIVYQEYLARQICKPHDSCMHYNYYSLLPTTRTFFLKEEEKFYGTVSVFGDSPVGLPIENIFSQEISKLRDEGRRIAEVGLLSLNSNYFNKKHYSLKNFEKQGRLFKLFQAVQSYSKYVLKATDLIIGVHPKHQDLYKYINFEPFGPVKTYHGANGKPALLMRQDIDTFHRKTLLLKGGPGMYLFGNRASVESTEQGFGWSAQTVKDFLFHIKPMWESLSDQQKKHIKNCYPALDVEVECSLNMLRKSIQNGSV